MSVPGLKQLRISHLRGSVTPFSFPFARGKKLTLVYGENGSGKSTVCDALEFIGKGKVGSLENRGLGPLEKYWPTVGRGPGDVTVAMEYTDESTCLARMVRRDVIVHPPANRPRVEVLRRSQILSLVQAKPADRYAAIRRFIDVSGIETSEANLRQLIRDLKSNREVAVARISENEDAIRRFWEAAGATSGHFLAWAVSEATRDSGASKDETAALNSLRTAFSRLEIHPARIASAEGALEAAKTAATAAEAEERKCLQSIASDAGEVMGLLEAAQTFLHSHPSLEACPLCESSDKIDGLAERVRQRLDAFAALQSLRGRTKSAGNDLQRAEQQLAAVKKTAGEDAEAFEQARSASSWSTDLPMPAEAAPVEPQLLGTWLQANAHLPAAWNEVVAKRQDREQFLATLKGALKTYTDNLQAQKDLDALLPKLTAALEITESERRSFTDNVLARIADEVGRTYELVHPGEGLNKISLELDSKKRASLEIGAAFWGRSRTPPQAYFSDSHLDTLGLCVFLALAALDGPEDTILVLDDVLGSVDEPHVERLIETLYEEAVKFRHCLITTHYRPWKEKLRWGWLRNGQCHFVELARWDKHRGLTLAGSIPDLERLRTLLAEDPPDPQLVCSKGGVILEAVLDFLTQLYECSVPRRAAGRYTLGDLLPAIGRKLRQALEVEILTTDEAGAITAERVPFAPILEELGRIAQVRNVFGCHFNALSFELLDSDAIAFGQGVMAFADALICPESGWPRSKKSGKYWANAGETRRLYPLQQPS